MSALVHDEASKLEGDVSEDLPVSSVSSSSFTSLVAAEVARHNADFERKLKAEMDATIARKVEAKVTEILNARSAAAPPPSPQLSSSDEGTPRLSRVWQGMLLVTSLPCPVCASMYAWTGQSWFAGMAQSLYSLCLSCVVLLLFSSPANKSIEKALIIYVSSWFLAVLGGGTVGTFITDEEGDPFWGGFCALALPVWLIIFYFGMMARRRIGTFPRRRLEEYVANTVFLQGIIVCLPPIVYLTTESIQCLVKNTDAEGFISDTCGGIITPTLSITVMLFCFLFVRVVFFPLSTIKITAYQFASFKELAFRLCLQMVLFSIAGFGNIIMFGTLREGPETSFIFWLWNVCFSALMTILASELFHIVFGNRTDESHITLGPRKSTLEVLEQMSKAASGSVGIA